VVAELGDDDVETAVTVDVRRLDIGHPAQAVGKRDPLEPAVVRLPQPLHASEFVIHRQKGAEIGHHQVHPPIRVEINRPHLRGLRLHQVAKGS
jgi:hypothetical protein